MKIWLTAFQAKRNSPHTNPFFSLSCRTSILGISFGAAFLLLAFILFVCFAGQLLVGTSNIELF